MTRDQFKILHSEIMMYFQCIEFDLKRIYAGMSSEDSFRLCMALAGAEAETEGTNPPTKERVMELFDSAPISGQ